MIKIKENLNQIVISILLIGIILISGCGQKENRSSSAEPTSIVTKESKASKFNCKDILPDNNFIAITGRNPQEFDFAETSESDEILICGYSGKPDTVDYGTGIQFGVSSGIYVRGYEEFKNYIQQRKDISGVGSDAYFDSAARQLHVLSSNKKYRITVTVWSELFASGDEQRDLDIATKLAKIIDQNLDKY